MTPRTIPAQLSPPRVSIACPAVRLRFSPGRTFCGCSHFSHVPLVSTAEVVKEEEAALRTALAQASVEFVAMAPASRPPDAATSQLPSEEMGADKIATDTDEEAGMCGVCLGLLWEQPDEDGHAPKRDGAMRPLGAKCLRLPCNHAYHRQCLERWLVEWRGGQCPTCRADVM